MESTLSERARELLEVAGWFPNRRVETHDFEQELAGLGCPFFPIAKEFLSEFGGINLNCSVGLRAAPSFLCFTTEMFHRVRSFDIKEDVERVGRPLCVICVAENPFSGPGPGSCTWMMDSEGNVYECTDVEYPELIAHSGREAIENAIVSMQDAFLMC